MRLGFTRIDERRRALEVVRAVAVLQGLAKVDQDPRELRARIVGSLAPQGESPPPWFADAFVAAVRARLRELLGRWRSTPFGLSLEVTWSARRP